MRKLTEYKWKRGDPEKKELPFILFTKEPTYVVDDPDTCNEAFFTGRLLFKILEYVLRFYRVTV